MCTRSRGAGLEGSRGSEWLARSRRVAAELPDALRPDLMMSEMGDFELIAALQAKAAWREMSVGRRYRARTDVSRLRPRVEQRAGVRHQLGKRKGVFHKICST